MEFILKYVCFFNRGSDSQMPLTKNFLNGFPFLFLIAHTVSVVEEGWMKFFHLSLSNSGIWTLKTSQVTFQLIVVHLDWSEIKDFPDFNLFRGRLGKSNAVKSVGVLLLEIWSSFEKLDHISQKENIFSIASPTPQVSSKVSIKTVFYDLFYAALVIFSALNFITSSNFTAATSKCNDLVAIKQSIVIKATFPNLEMFKEGKQAKRKFPWHSEARHKH